MTLVTFTLGNRSFIVNERSYHSQTNMTSRALILLLTCSTISACRMINTDALLRHQIIAAPEKKSIGIEEESPLDVTAERRITPITCTEPRAE